MEQSTTPVGSLERGLAVLDALVEAGPIRQSELTRRLGLPKATVHRLLQTLDQAGYVVRSAHGQLHPGPKLLLARLSLVAPLVDVCRPTLEQLARETGEAANLAILVGTHAEYLDAVRGTHAVGIFTEIGTLVPLHATGVGKALLSVLASSRQSKLVASSQLTRYTRSTLTDPARLLSEVARGHARGYCLDMEEYMDGVRCCARAADVLGVPVAVSISGPAARLDAERLEEIGRLLCASFPP